MKDLRIYIIVGLLTPFSAFSQNLIPNGDFEEYLVCPSLDNGYYLEGCAENWFSPGISTPDYFNSCSQQLDMYGNFSMSTPTNGHGYQEAHSGQGYAGIVNDLNPGVSGSYEYMSIKLSEPLEANRYYKIEYYVSLSDSIWWIADPYQLQYFDSFGAAFSTNSPNELYEGVPFSSRYTWPVQVESEPGVFFNDSLGWQKFEGAFMATGGEEFLTLGCFNPYEEIETNLYYYSTNITTYYYIDDVTLVPLDSFGQTYYETPDEAFMPPNVFTPNGDGVNDVINFKSKVKGSVTVLNRWGTVVAESELPYTWDGTSDKQECADGVYFYVFKTEEELKTGMISLIR